MNTKNSLNFEIPGKVPNIPQKTRKMHPFLLQINHFNSNLEVIELRSPLSTYP
jgi:hypothetical protein